MVLEVTLDTFNVIPAQAGIHDLTILVQLAEEKSWMPACAGMTGIVGQSRCGLV
jgi:hypothetical protein